ncbi:glycosyltransferase family 2 protein [Desulfitobacterium hafniense]|uniref:glycosyltransferase family 2 protein n=1 Tax=Desulfitobacterium hafniense TaxID=49338 RepID=UPI00037425A2|nr:glycosyltransferase family 2 protein [Desulfitobacterium hafniense]
MGKIYIATCAFNAEKTLKRCVDSVLNQTFNDFVYYLCDNASTDRTGELVKQYAAQDSRIVPSHNRINHDWSENSQYALLPHTISDEDYFCLLDADDELRLTFFEEMMDFLQKNKLDLAVCGNDFIDLATGKLTGIRKIDKELILQRDSEFSDYFPKYHQFMRTGWAKLYTGKVARERYVYSNYPPSFPRGYGGDTYIVFRCLRAAKRVGIYPKSLYRYYISPSSISYQIHPQRVECDRILYDDGIDFLKTKCGVVTQHNEDFLLCVYMNAIKDTLNVLMNAKISEAEKIYGVIDIFTAQQTKQLVVKSNFGASVGSVAVISGQRRELFSVMSNWLLALSEVPDKLVEGYCDAGELLCATVENAAGWLCFKKLRVQFLIEQNQKDEAKDKLVELIELIPNDPDVIAFQQYLNVK